MSEMLARTKIEMGETAATIICEKKYFEAAVNGIARARAEIKSYARGRRDFLLSLEPVGCDANAPKVVQRMCKAAAKTGVGPMAAVAGAIALAGVECAVEEGATHCIIDNGGDIAMVLDQPITVGILGEAGQETLPAVRLAPTDGKVRGLCTSSGIFGHSISFGRAKAATVMASDPVLADAAATTLGNGCRSDSQMRDTLKSLSGIDEIIWAIAIMDDKIGTLGNVPDMSFARALEEKITVHSRFLSCALSI